jgi:Rrf2 family transcriptional regulator, nitric oxide-sensitive transcriptional repressor
MRLTAMTDYALRVLMYAGARPDRLCTIAEIADAHGISEAHLMKVAHRLAQDGWLATQRGRGGGLRLGRVPQAINLGDVVRGVEPDFTLVECFARDPACVLHGHCGLANVLHSALTRFMDELDRHTLADLLPPAPAARQPGRARTLRIVAAR